MTERSRRPDGTHERVEPADQAFAEQRHTCQPTDVALRRSRAAASSAALRTDPTYAVGTTAILSTLWLHRQSPPGRSSIIDARDSLGHRWRNPSPLSKADRVCRRLRRGSEPDERQRDQHRQRGPCDLPRVRRTANQRQARLPDLQASIEAGNVSSRPLGRRRARGLRAAPDA